MADWTPIFRGVYDPLKAGSIDATDTEPHDRGIVRAMHAKYKPNKYVVGDPLKTIFIARLNPKTNEEQIERIFSAYGSIKRLKLVRDIVTGFSKGYAFVEFLEQRGADSAQRKANKTDIDGCEVFVDYECERTLKGWVPRRLGGGLGGRKESGQLRFGGRDRPFRKPLFDNLTDLKQRYDKNYEKVMPDSESRVERYQNDRNRNRKERKDDFRNNDRAHYDRSDDSHYNRSSSHSHNREKDPRKYNRESDQKDYKSRDRSKERGRDYKQEKDRERNVDRHREKNREDRIRDKSRERTRRRSGDRSRNRKRERSREDSHRSENKYTREQTVDDDVNNEEINKLIQEKMTSIWDNEESLESNNMDRTFDDVNK